MKRALSTLFVVIFCTVCAVFAFAGHIPPLGVSLRRFTPTLGVTALSLSMQRKLALQMREYRLGTLKPSNTYSLRELGVLPDTKFKDYNNLLEETQKLAKLADDKIFYQGTSETVKLHPLEIATVQREVQSLLDRIEEMQVYFHQDGDPVLRQAASYLKRVKKFYQMLSTGMIIPLDEEVTSVTTQAEQSYKWEVFFLEKLQDNSSINQFPLPARLRVAIISDKNVLDAFEKMQQRENLPSWKFDVYQDPAEFLSAPGHLSYDLVLTDILIENGGGLYLARRLRYENFQGGILALTEFPRQDEIGIKMKAEGIDGMISSYMMDETPLHASYRIARALRHYFYYKEHENLP